MYIRFRLILASVLVGFLAVTARSARADPEPTPDDIERWTQSVVLLITGPAWCTGVVIDDLGLVATAYHCVASGLRPHVRTRDGVEAVGRIRALAPGDDLALVDVPALAGKVAPLTLRADAPRQGEGAWAIGHPYAPAAEGRKNYEGLLQWSVSHGIVSAVGEHFIQVDTPLNPGNSGGPLVDGQGGVIGIASRRLSGDNIAFASPTALLVQLRDQPRKALVGGTWGMGLTSLEGVTPGWVTTLGMAAHVSVRDRILLSGALHVPLAARWAAVDYGEASWVGAEAWLRLRQRFGHGRLSTALDLGGGMVSWNRLQDDSLGFWGQSRLDPALEGRVDLGGSAVRLVWLPTEGLLLLGIDLEILGLLGTF